MSAPKGNKNNHKYKPEYARQVYQLCLMGARDKDLASFFEVHRDTIFHWAAMYPDFASARRRGKREADAEVAYCLFKRAIGLHVTKQKVTSSGQVIQYQEEIPPDVRAMKFWLKCRRRSNWSTNAQVDFSNHSNNPLSFLLPSAATNSEHDRSRQCS